MTTPVPSRLVSKPIPKAQTEDPREFQLGQIRRRFSPKETRLSSSNGGEDAVVLTFSLAPSDPDFPFDLDKLQCSLTVPATYPGPDAESKPKLKVANKDMPRGFAINIERGFDGLVEERTDATLLALMSALDKNLEKFLSEKKVETVKLVANADTRHLVALPVRSVGPPAAHAVAQEDLASSQPAVSAKTVEVFTDEQKAEAQNRREMETRQLEARLGRLPLFKKPGDGIAYTIPIEPRKHSELAPALRVVKAIQLFVPLLYPLQCCRIQLEDIKPEAAKNTEGAFEEHARQSKDMSLIGHVNYLTQNFHILAKKLPPPEPKISKPLVGKEATPIISGIMQVATAIRESEDDRSHIKIIPRPPEWTVVDSSDVSDTDDDYSYDSGDESEGGGIEIEQSNPENSQITERNPERGTALSFPFIELHGIELLELTTLNLTVKCERCKNTMDFTSLKSNTPQTSSCKKCAALLTVAFRHELIHANAIRAGFLDLQGCTITDLLPSTFTPTCSSCSTAYPSPPGFICVRGSTITNPCRTCHQKLSISIPSVRFLRITSATTAATSATGPRRKREVLGLVTGTELPDRGRCRHYAKSYRWFRFGCCDRVYACDRCHDEKEAHPNEHAGRMICGWCSREQAYRPEECAFCGRGVVGRRGKGFWEGGKGTRDRVRMSRKDPRKFKRVGGKAKEKDKEKA